ncbi:MAG TPA: guanylate kinase [bacterium]|nr:guanylate kinase [bacterium]
MKGKLIVISAPSGAGKSTICDELLKRVDNIIFSISVTTRPCRTNEIDGVDYFFISEKEFKEMIEKNELLEWAKVHNNYYGTPKDFVIKNLEAGKDVLLDIDVQGAEQVRQKTNDAIFIFIMAPSLEELERRLRNRKTDSEESIQRRLANAKKELEYKDKYDYIIINDIVEKAVNEIIEIIKMNRKK